MFNINDLKHGDIIEYLNGLHYKFIDITRCRIRFCKNKSCNRSIIRLIELKDNKETTICNTTSIRTSIKRIDNE